MSVLSLTSSITGHTGRILIQTVMHVINLMTFSSLALKDWFFNNKFFRARSYSTTVTQIIFTGVDALPTMTVLGLATGFVFTFRLISVLSSMGETADITQLMIPVICLGLGPFLAAIIIISRTGSAIVVDLGNMKLHGEIQALEHLGININNYLIAPRIIGTAISQLAITVYFTAIALLSGIILSGFILDTSHFKMIRDISQSFTPLFISIFVLKNIIFGFVIATIACYNGIRVHRSATEVPQRTTTSIVQSLIMVFAIDALFALMIFI